MNYNFDIIVAGCNTNCLHCYVNGGPSKPMTYDSFELCVEKLKPILEHFGDKASVTLDNEVFNNKRAKDILLKTHDVLGSHYYHHGSTTAIGLMLRDDKDELIQTLQDCGYNELSMTIHGNREHHNEIVKNNIAYDTIIKAADYLHKKGVKLVISMILSKYLVQDKDNVTEFLNTVPHDCTYMAIPNYMPTDRMRKYEELRADFADCFGIMDYLDKWGLDQKKFLENIKTYNESDIYTRFKDIKDFSEIKKEQPQDMYFTIDQDLDLYYGNTGMKIRKLGNMANLDTDNIIKIMESLEANYSPLCSFDLKKAPSMNKLVKKISLNITDKVYPSNADCIARWLDMYGVKTILL